MLTKNDKITSSNRGVEKAHWKHQGWYVGLEFVFSPTIKNIKMFRVECIAYNVDWPIKPVIFFVLALLEWCGAGKASNFLDFGVCSMFPSCSASSQKYSATCSLYHHTFIP